LKARARESQLSCRRKRASCTQLLHSLSHFFRERCGLPVVFEGLLGPRGAEFFFLRFYGGLPGVAQRGRIVRTWPSASVCYRCVNCTSTPQPEARCGFLKPRTFDADTTVEPLRGDFRAARTTTKLQHHGQPAALSEEMRRLCSNCAQLARFRRQESWDPRARAFKNSL